MVARTPANKNQRYPSEPPTAEEVERILEEASLRDRAIITLMYRGGLRCAEALSVRRCDFTVAGDTSTVRVLLPKGAARGKKPRVVGLGRKSTRIVLDWIAARPETAGDAAPLCCTRNGTRVLTAHIRSVLPKLAAKAGIERRVHPHALRHGFACEAVMEGRPLPWISRALGHTSLVTTMLYLEHLAPVDIITGMQERD